MRLLLAALVMFNCSVAHAVECRPSKGTDGWYSWRIIDGQKCWYKGRQVLDKTKLHWPMQHFKPAYLEVCCWPPLESKE
jgi:hypothetical protein